MRQLYISQSMTHRSLSLDKYLHEIAKLPRLTADEEVELAQRIRQGSQEAINTLTRANLLFVVSVAKQYQFRGLALLDLIDEGNLGLIKAAKRFDETRGFKFISFAVWWIRQSIIQAVSEQARLVRLPSNKIGLGHRLQTAVSQLEQVHERNPSPEELANVLGIETEQVISAGNQDLHHVSLDLPVGGQEEGSLMDSIADKNAVLPDRGVGHVQSLKIDINRVLGSLNARQKDIICYFYGIGVPYALSLSEIGAKYNMSHERIRQIKDKTLKQLRSSKKIGLLKEYLGA